jgi:hypothetical protein
MKSRNLVMVVVLLLIAVAIWYFGNPEDGGPNPENRFKGSDTTQLGSTVDTSSNNLGQTVEEVPNALVGELMASNDKKKGNLMIKLDGTGRIIYLNTSRDFSSLIGKHVQVSIEGSTDDFRLLDIKEK